MKIIINNTAIHRRASLAHTTSLGGLLILLGSVAVSLWKPAWSVLTAAMLFGGFAIAVVGIAYANRWVKKPRPEDVLARSLKGLSDQHRLYHYTPLADHILLTPNGIVVIETVSLEGQFTYSEGVWKQKLTIGRALRYIVEEKLGDPTNAAQAASAAVKTYLYQDAPHKLQARLNALPVQAVVVFTHPLAQLQVKDAPLPVVQPDKLLKKIPHPVQRLEAEVHQYARSRLDGLLPVQIP